MNNLHEPLSAEDKKYLEEDCGLTPYRPHAPPAWADPDSAACKSAFSNHFFRSYLQCRHPCCLFCWKMVRPKNRCD